jgi:hypothetical protein
MHTLQQLAEIPDADLARVDPVEVNLVVARGIPSLAGLDIPRYQAAADGWAEEVAAELPRQEGHFWCRPRDWKGDMNFFRLGVLCWYIDERLGVAYREDQRHLKSVRYTDPSDLFLNGVMDTRRGTCGNMAALHVALAWRLGWPVSLARAGHHQLVRYEDGVNAYNVEATNAGKGGFRSESDEFYVKEYSYSNSGDYLGVDLRALGPREMLGIFVGGRARHFRDTGRVNAALQEYALAHRLYPAEPIFRDGAAEARRRGLPRRKYAPPSPALSLPRSRGSILDCWHKR